MGNALFVQKNCQNIKKTENYLYKCNHFYGSVICKFFSSFFPSLIQNLLVQIKEE